MQQHYYNAPQMPPESDERRPRRRHGRFRRFVRGYLMLVGAVTTLYGLCLLVAWLFVQLQPIMQNALQ